MMLETPGSNCDANREMCDDLKHFSEESEDEAENEESEDEVKNEESKCDDKPVDTNEDFERKILEGKLPSKSFRVLTSKPVETEDDMKSFITSILKKKKETGVATRVMTLKKKFIVGTVIHAKASQPNKYIRLWGFPPKQDLTSMEWVTLIARGGQSGVLCFCPRPQAWSELSSKTDYSFTKTFACNLLDAKPTALCELKQIQVVGHNTSKIQTTVTGPELEGYQDVANWVNSIATSYTTAFADNISNPSVSSHSAIEIFKKFTATVNKTQVTLRPRNVRTSLTIEDALDIADCALQLKPMQEIPEAWERFYFFDEVNPDRAKQLDDSFQKWFELHFDGTQTTLTSSSSSRDAFVPSSQKAFRATSLRFGNSFSRFCPELRETTLFKKESGDFKKIGTLPPRPVLPRDLYSVTEERPSPSKFYVSIGGQSQPEKLIDWVECVIMGETSQTLVRIAKRYFLLSANYLKLIEELFSTLCKSSISNAVLTSLGFQKMPYPAIKETRKAIRLGEELVLAHLDQENGGEFRRNVLAALHQKRDCSIKRGTAQSDLKLPFEGVWNQQSAHWLETQGIEVWSGDANTSSTNGVELFDIALIKDSTAYLLHVKAGFNADSVRAVCAQILAAAAYLKTRLSSESMELDEGCESTLSDAIESFREVKTLVFVCVVVETIKKERNLFDGSMHIGKSDTIVPLLNIVQTMQSLEHMKGVAGIEFKFDVFQLKNRF